MKGKDLSKSDPYAKQNVDQALAYVHDVYTQISFSVKGKVFKQDPQIKVRYSEAEACIFVTSKHPSGATLVHKIYRVLGYDLIDEEGSK